MKVLDILSAPWAIQPAKLLEIQSIYAAHLRGERADIAAIEARLGRPLANEHQAATSYNIVDGVAIIPIEGIVAKRMNLFSQVSGGVSTELVSRDLQAALADPAVHSIVLSIDSPGGTVPGVQTLAAEIKAARAVKPIVSHANGTMASGAYWFGAAAQAVYIEDRTTIVGSIGVATAHKDVSVAEAQAGVKTTEITAGKYKRVASQYAPLSEEGRQTIQDHVDHIYKVFVDDVAAARGVTVDKVLQNMADGRDFIGQQAVDAGLVDGVMPLTALIAKLNADRQERLDSMKITRASLAAEAPDLLAEIQAEAAAAERARIQAVEAQSLPGHEAVIAALKFDGKTSGAEAAVAILAAERKTRSTAAAQLAADAPQPVPQAAAKAVEPAPAAEDESAPIEDRAKATWEASPAVRAEFGSLAAYTAFRKADAGGRVRVLRTRAAA